MDEACNDVSAAQREQEGRQIVAAFEQVAAAIQDLPATSRARVLLAAATIYDVDLEPRRLR